MSVTFSTETPLALALHTYEPVARIRSPQCEEGLEEMTQHRQHVVLCADDEPQIRRLIADVLGSRGFQVLTAEDGREALSRFEADRPDLVLLDLRMPHVDGLQVLSRIKTQNPALPVVLISGHGDIRTAVDAMRLGAYDFIEKPFLVDHLLATVERAVQRLDSSATRAGAPAAERPLTDILGESRAMREVVAQIQRVAGTTFTVIVIGETGTGKELVSRAIHEASDRNGGELVAVDCGAIPENLIESELFGHERGAFTGADRRREGYFLQARGSTLFLDEIANLPLATQAKLLRALQERVIHPLGGRPISIDVRVIAATNVSLEAGVRTGRFRSDLFYRLSEFTITIPPLRDRREDIPILAHRFLDETSVELSHPRGRSLHGDAIDLLLQHDWPGNVRQLRNVIRRAALIGPEIIRPEHIDLVSRSIASTPEEAGSLPAASLKTIAETALSAAERRAIGEALIGARGNKSRAARLLGTDYKTLHLKMRRYGMEVDADSPRLPTGT
jgi:DNA-binding NtrC family response regulator